MKTGIFLSYKGLGANLLHLSYCHEIAKKFGPVSLITLNPKLNEILKDDPNFNEVIYLNKFHKKITDIFHLSKFLRTLNLKNFFIFYPSLRYLLSSKIAGIENIYHYPLFKKKSLHLVKTAKIFTEKSLGIKECPTETKIFINDEKIKDLKKNDLKKVILGIGSSGPTTKWGYKNYSALIRKLNNIRRTYFYLLCGSNESEDAQKIIQEVGKETCESLSNKSISEVKHYIAQSKIYIGNDSFGHHISCQLGKPSFIILLDTPRAYSDYSVNQKRIIPPGIDLDNITHDSRLDPNTISVDKVLDKVKEFI
ncbi:lipopolysaccharide heptosyltransferase family protein [Pelagibacterales bacterium SAG-MED39]|nr:lipopolysaccharide heptosyltransferase family protein [Pelagibacterales bacterium SAG-MED39]